jgi:threonyl-tRNA synthetase
MSIKVTLPDGKELALPDGATGADAAAAIGPGLARAALAVVVDEPGEEDGPATIAANGQGHADGQADAGEVRDLARVLPDGARISIVTGKSPEALELIRHDAAHVLATAVMELYPGVKISIGPAIKEGFYYDFEFPDGVSISDAELPAIEERMRTHIKAAEPFEREDVSVASARDRFAAEEQDYKVELIDDLAEAADPQHPLQSVSLYTNGPFTDLCRGPHSPSTANVKAFKLQSVAGAYWRGDSSRTMLTRIYGTAFLSKDELGDYLERLELARTRDHRRIGRDLGLYFFSDLSPGSPFWTPAGMVIWNQLTGLWRAQNRARGYHEVQTPILYDAELWKESGHWEKYRENMYLTEVEGRLMGMKPMNCPAHIQIYKDQRRSYRDLPIRYSEAGLVHRHEPSGVLHGLLRVRHITQDDAHIFCTEEQIEGEVIECLRFAFSIYQLFGFPVRLELSTRPQQRIGSDEMWDHAEAALAGALRAEGLTYELNPGDGAFYGPKIDLHMTDSIGRSWQLGTVQLDYSMPERFELKYTGQDNAEHRPVMIHRALLGSFERFIGILIEHFGGELPLWLAPVQAIVLTVSERAQEWASEVLGRLEAEGMRVELDGRDESIGRKVREAELRKIPYMVVIGAREAEEQTISVREHGAGAGEGQKNGAAETATPTIEEFLERARAVGIAAPSQNSPDLPRDPDILRRLDAQH